MSTESSFPAAMATPPMLEASQGPGTSQEDNWSFVLELEGLELKDTNSDGGKGNVEQ